MKKDVVLSLERKIKREKTDVLQKIGSIFIVVYFTLTCHKNIEGLLS